MSEHSQTGDFVFRDFDEDDVFTWVGNTVASPSASNFVVEFGHNRARIAQNLEREHFEALYPKGHQQRDPDYPIRWINIWDTSEKKDVTKFLGERYDFSPRMISLMQRARDFNEQLAMAKAKSLMASKNQSRKSTTQRPSSRSVQNDLEKGSTSTAIGTPSVAAQAGATQDTLAKSEEVKLFLLLKNKVNYSSIDQTDNALCIGAHWLHEKVQLPGAATKKSDNSIPSLMPPKHWLWLVLGNDNTVISLHEHPFIEELGKLEEENREKYKAACLEQIRANTLSVLLQLSRCGFEKYQHKPLSQSSVRNVLSDKFNRWEKARANNPELVRPNLSVEGASNLFYYLFEDYAAAATFRAAEHTLGRLTPIVLGSDTRKLKNQTAEIIPKLHMLGKDLRELKHLFENYKAMIHKILSTTQTEKSYNALSRTTTKLLESGEQEVVMAKSARERFERLGERLQWLMLNTIQGYQDETAALSDTYFNLMQQKDTAATARLNRSATLLAKLSVFFLPLSFVTSYYSIQIEEMYAAWHTSDFDRAMTITVCLAFVSLFFFNKILFFLIDSLDKVSGTIEYWVTLAWRVIVGWVGAGWNWLMPKRHRDEEHSLSVREDQAEASQTDDRLSQKGMRETGIQR